MKKDKMMQKFNEALALYDLNNYIQIDHLANLEHSVFEEIEREMSEEYPSYSPESLLIEKDIEDKKIELFNSLSQEAKEIINIITDCPKELSEICFHGNLDRVYMPRFISLVRKQWKSRLIVKEIFSEVFNYANKIRAFNGG